MLKKIQSISGEDKGRILLDLLPNLSYEQFKSILGLNIKIFKQKTIYTLLLKSYNEDWFQHIKEIKTLNHRSLYLSFLEIENDDDLYGVLEQAFDGDYENLSKLQPYDQIELLFFGDSKEPSHMAHISDLPEDPIFEIAKNLNHEEVIALCVSHSSFSELCSKGGWLKLLIVKYPDLKWNNTTIEDAKDIHEMMQDIEMDININNKDSLYDLFMGVIGSGYLDVLKYLISIDREYGIDPFVYDVMILASEAGRLNIIKYLLTLHESYGIVPSNINDALITASQNGHIDIVEYFMNLPRKYDIDPTDQDNAAIIRASQNGHIDIVKYLISLPKSYGIDPSALNNRAIIWASISGRLDVVKYLISLDEQYGIDPSDQNNNAIVTASYRGLIDIVEYLMTLPKRYGIDPSAQNNKAITLAIAHGYLKVVKYLISLDEEYDIDPSAQNNKAITLANRNGHKNIVEYLKKLPESYGIKL